MLTVPELLRLSACCKQWHSVVQTELAEYTEAVLPMYRFIMAWPRAPKMQKVQSHEWQFTEADWQPFVAALGTRVLTPRQWALYYTFCYWMALEHLKPTWMFGTTVTDWVVTMRLFPSGLVAQLSTLYMDIPTAAPYILYNYFDVRHRIMLHLAGTNDDMDLDVCALAGALYLRPAFTFNFNMPDADQPVQYTLFQLTEDVKSFAAFRLAYWDVHKTIKCDRRECLAVAGDNV